MHIKYLDNSQIFDAGKHYSGLGTPAALRRRVRLADGSVGEERLSPQARVKYVKRCGTVANITIAHGPLLGTKTQYAVDKIAYQESQGGIPYGRCTFSTDAGRLAMSPEMLAAGDPCDPLDFGPGRKYGDHCACAHVEMIIAERQGKHSKAEAIREEQKKTHEKREDERKEMRDNAILEELLIQRKGDGGAADMAGIFAKIASNADMMKHLNALSNAMEKHPDKVVAGAIEEDEPDFDDE